MLIPYIVSGKSCKISDLMICSREHSETISHIDTELMNANYQNAESVASIPNIEFSDEGSEASPRDADDTAFLHGDSQTYSTAFMFSLSDSNVPSYLRISEKDSRTTTMIFSEESSEKLCTITNKKSSSNFVDYNSRISTNYVNSCQCYPEIRSSFMTTHGSSGHLCLTLQSKSPMRVLDNNLSNINTNQLEVLKTTDGKLELYDSDLSASDSKSETYHSNLKVYAEESKHLLNDSLPLKALIFSGDLEYFLSDLNLSDSDAESYSSDLKFPDSDAESYSSDLKFSDSDAESYCSDLKLSDSDAESYRSDLKLSDSDVESDYSDFMFSESYKESKYDMTAEALSNVHLTSDNDRAILASLLEKKKNVMFANSFNIEDRWDLQGAVIYSENPNKPVKNYLSSSNSIPSKNLAFSDNVSDDGYSDIMLTDTDADSKPVKQSSDVKLLKEKNLIETNPEFQSKINRILSDERAISVKSNPFLSIDSNFSDSDLKIYESDLDISKSDQKLSFKQPNFGLNEEKLLKLQKFQEIRRKSTEFFVGFPALKNGETTIARVETMGKDSDSLDNIFKTVIKCHPIKKFEFPPFKSANAERTLDKLEDTFTKYACNSMHLYGIGEQNILDSLSDVDSHSFMVFEVTDSFSQNSNIICNALIKIYLNISAKVNLLLIKKVKGISSEEFELRMRGLRSLEDEIGCISAKLIATINNWEKKFHEIKQNIGQSRNRSCDLHHVGIVKICLKLFSILLKFLFEKQLNLEDYEACLLSQ